MPDFTRGLGVALAVLTLSACGTTTASEQTGPSLRPGAVTATRAPGGGTIPKGIEGGDPPGPTFPLTLRRTGGIAGFDDTVVIAESGDISVETRTIRRRMCRLAEAQRVQLLDVLSTLRHGEGAVTESVPQSDVIRISLTDAHLHPFDLSDPSLGSVAGMVSALIADVTLTAPASATCRTATATPTS